MKNTFTPPVATICGSLSLAALPSYTAALAIGASALVGVLSAEKANAVITITATESGPDVIFSYSGSITDLDNFPTGGPSTFGGVLLPNLVFRIGDGTLTFNVGPVTGPTSFGPGTTLFTANSNSGSPFLLNFSSISTLGVPAGYTPGTFISGTSTYNNSTFASLGVTPGTYVWTLGNTAQDTITLNIGATPVPFESDALPVVGSALFMAGGLWWKKKRSQANVAEFVAKQ